MKLLFMSRLAFTEEEFSGNSDAESTPLASENSSNSLFDLPDNKLEDKIRKKSKKEKREKKIDPNRPLSDEGEEKGSKKRKARKSKREKMEVSTSAQKETSAAQEKSVKPTDINRTSAWLKNFLKTKRVEQDILVPEIEVSLLLGC